MHEYVLRDYFLGTSDIADLRADLQGEVTQTSYDVFSQHVVSMDADFDVTAIHLVSLCDAVLAGHLPAVDLSVIAFCLVASGHFRWDAKTPTVNVIEETLHEWDSPEINYALNDRTIAKFRHRLITGQDTFTRADFATR